MRKFNDWDEKTIENQLKEMPSIKDRQNKEELFEKIQERLQEGHIKKRQQKSWFIPTIASAAVFFILLLLIPSFLNERNVTLDKPGSVQEDQMRMESNQPVDEDIPEMGVMEDPNEEVNMATVVNDFHYVAALQTDIEEQFRDQLVTIGIPAYNQGGEFIIPVTILAEGTNYLENFMSVMNSFSGEQWGIGSFPPIEINEISEEKGGFVKLDVPTNSLESLTSNEHRIYSLSLIETFSAQQRYIELQFSSDGEPGVLWGQTGDITSFSLQQPNRGYFLMETETGHIFLVKGNMVDPTLNIESDAYQNITLQESLQLMKEGAPERGYQAAIPYHVAITEINQTDEFVTITFENGTQLENNLENVAMLEAIMLAAKDFGHLFVKFEGVEELTVGPYHLNEFLPVPNYINFIQ